MLTCRYIDHLSCDKKDLAIFYQNTPAFKGSVVSTCHRIEVIDNKVLPPFEIMGYKSKSISGNREVCLRIAYIAAGVESVILGEPFVFDQVTNSFKGADPEILKYTDISLSLAKEARERFNFYSEADYTDIATRFLDNESVVIIGSGMLAKDIVKKLKHQPIIVTRNTSFKNATKINTLPRCEFQCIIATTGTSKYRKKVNRHLNESGCSLVVDLSSTPFLKNPSFPYITMYDDIFEKEITRTNNKLQGKVEPVKQFIYKKIYKEDNHVF